ncbi:hypothetical protein IRJ41_009855 [Triplophysa rosa]|uniref:Uncharacterized protein n=1 Tax=Triplophysa rosa TaxID=992332 RepID=A0A9W7WUG1_TRIRA|nr:hypothetical protein IRJ41_009855 [Triplophysa rosa]
MEGGHVVLIERKNEQDELAGPACRVDSLSGFRIFPGRNLHQWILHPVIAKGLSVLKAGR